MTLDLTQFRQPETDLTRRYDPAAFEARVTDFQVVQPVELRLKVHKDKERYRLVGMLTTQLELTCSRCLESFRLPIDARFDVRYLPQTVLQGSKGDEEEKEVEEDDLTDAFYRDETIDLGQLIDEQFYLALPMKPLCRTDCKGLCPHCGQNLNVESCDCQVRWEDPRLAALKALINPDKDNA
ncbi:MAG TPA: DUF177 domain-containing protein [Vicinamibacterales bacterium]|nr:DUF177 domain-containing protein [Vicinamibacterales bacterium]